MVAVLHDLNSAALYADELVLLNGGIVVATGTPHQVLQANLLTAVYEQPMAVVSHPFRDCPLVLAADV